MSQSKSLFEAVVAGDAQRVQALLAGDPSLSASRDASGVSAILTARYHGRMEIVALLCAAHADLDIFEASALGRASRVREIIEADPSLLAARSADGFTPLHLAAYFGDEETVAALIDRQADVNAVSGNPMSLTPLHSAAVRGARGIVERLLAAGASVNARQQGGWTPLHAAAHIGDVELIAILLAGGADIAATSDDKLTPLGAANAQEHTAAAERLAAAN